jgi:ATP-dependent exoDNAse (exonuclease V) beta subunit
VSTRVPPPDRAARERALDPATSFIVQAPAGSGKTELLIQRFLRLLAVVEQPEEVLAVTFTRKAAGEMRKRVVDALRQADRGEPPDEPHLRPGYELARAVLADESRKAWQLARHPARLSISTIDSVNAWLAGRAPLGAAGRALMRVTDQADRLYREAARATLALLGEDGEYAGPVAALLAHLDNDTARLERLLVAMLPRRDQWLRHVLGGVADREALERPLREVATHVIGRAAELLPPPLVTSLPALLSYAAGAQRDAGKPVSLAAWEGRATLPPATAGHLDAWRSLAGALLTGEGEWRRSINVNQGFPARPKAMKEAMLEALAACSGRDELRAALADVAALPGIAYAEGQWEVLRELSVVLRLAAAELRLAFANGGEVDFPEVAAAAIGALGAEDDPSELGLALDHRVRHVLVDEFQDTSLAQFDLLERLTAGWQPGDGRTVFLVGDPMQSIYRFRQAEVGLFMKVRDAGIGSIAPEFLQLRANFRSAPAVVEWNNRTFGQIFPRADDAVMGAVTYAPSEAARADVAGGVEWHWLGGAGAPDEAQLVARLAGEALSAIEANGGRAGARAERVCILVRSRAHAVRILDALREARIDFVAPEIENLERSGAAQDLLALTRALTQPADRLAWIGVLRAPWCGLSLADLHELLGAEQEHAVPELLSDDARVARLGPAGQAAVARLRLALGEAHGARGRVALRDLVEGAWLALGGPATLREAAERETVATVLALVEAVDAGGDCTDALWLGEQLATRHGSLGSGDRGVQVMTMHKAKGLEFDTVILPGLGRGTRGSDAPLLAWQDVPVGRGRAAPIVAPMGASGMERDPLHAWLNALDRRKLELETDRLLYVACTRAKRRLHLVASLLPERDDSGATRARRPHAGSLLGRLWPAVGPEAQAACAALHPLPRDAGGDHVWVQPRIRRLPADWAPPPAAAALALPPVAPAVALNALEYDWASSVAMHVGSVVHRWLELIARRGAEHFDARETAELGPRIRVMLAELGTPEAERERAAGLVTAALAATLADETGRWLLSGAHAEAESEAALTVVDGGRFRQVVIDRTFVDAGGTRWIVDYKTSRHEGGDVEEFLEREVERYRDQLRRYRDAFAAIDGRPARAALYFPLLGQFREVVPGP